MIILFKILAFICAVSFGWISAMCFTLSPFTDQEKIEYNYTKLIMTSCITLTLSILLLIFI